MSWALFWFLCTVVLAIMLARSQKEVALLTEAERRQRIYCNGFTKQIHGLLEARYLLKMKTEKYKQVLARLQNSLSKCRAINSKLRFDLTEMTIERNSLREEIEKKNKKRSFHMS